MIEFDEWMEKECSVIQSAHGDEFTAAQEAWDFQQSKIDELQARFDVILKACDNSRKDIIREHHTEYDKGWKDCATIVYYN